MEIYHQLTNKDIAKALTMQDKEAIHAPVDPNVVAELDSLFDGPPPVEMPDFGSVLGWLGAGVVGTGALWIWIVKSDNKPPRRLTGGDDGRPHEGQTRTPNLKIDAMNTDSGRTRSYVKYPF